MTTHLPYQQHPPAPAYPTAPPWAAPAQAAPEEAPPPAYGSVTPWGAPLSEYGQLLVPYPEEMINAARPRPPAWWPVVIWTFFFGILGIVSAARRANQARRVRNSPAPYWIAWGLTMAVTAGLSVGAIAVALPAYLTYRESAVTKQVQDNIQTDGRLQESAGVTAATATCDPLGPRDSGGTRLYDCVLALEDGRTGSLKVSADSDGNWTAVRK